MSFGIPADPFGERPRRALHEAYLLLGTRCEFVVESRALRELVRDACARLPQQSLPGRAPVCRIELRLRRSARKLPRIPPPLEVRTVGGVITGIIDADNFVVIAPHARSAGLVLSEGLLERRYHARYELLEFALLTLLSRVRNLVPLHAACVTRGRDAVLLLGDSGAGKSTLCALAVSGGLRLIGEDSTFVDPRSMFACGLASRLHLDAGAARRLGAPDIVRRLLDSPVIVRRSGVRKHELDLRSGDSIARPARLAAVIKLSRASRAGTPWRSVSHDVVMRALRSEQRYARAQPSWRAFERGVARLPAFELFRGAQPADSLAALRAILASLA